MTTTEACVVCRDPISAAQGITCYFCGRMFHYCNTRECGLVLPNPSAC